MGKVTTEYWDPRIRIHNLVQTTKWDMRSRMLENGEMGLKWTISGQFMQEFGLNDFPRDAQDLVIKIGSTIPKWTVSSSLGADEKAEVRTYITGSHVSMQCRSAYQ